MEVYTLYFDGACSPKNPGGTAAYGFKLCRSGEELETGHGVIGTGPAMSNNVAEFAALHHGLQAFTNRYNGQKSVLNVRGDSKLVINIMSRRWKANPQKLYYNTYLIADVLLRTIRKLGVTVGFDWIPREANTHCDDLSKTHLKTSATLA